MEYKQKETIDKVEKIVKVIETSDLSEGDFYNIFKWISFFINSDNEMDNYYGRKIIIHLLNKKNKVPDCYKAILADFISASGFFPYLEKEKDYLNDNDLSNNLIKQFHKSKKINKYFHSAQNELCNVLLNSNRNIVVSAPTSFGKSLLIEELVANNKYQNIVIVQPTLALLNETRNKLRKYNDLYKIIIRTSQKPDDNKGNLFLLTAERVVEYKYFPKIDFFILDEFYKISKLRDDERYEELNKACIKLIDEQKARFYFLGPPISDISNEFKEKYNVLYKDYNNYNIVDVEEEWLFNQNSIEFKVKKDKQTKEQVLFEKLYELKNEQTIIYCPSPNVSIELAVKFADFLIEKKYQQQNLPLIEWLEEYISKEWEFIKCLKCRIGVHNGAFQKHLNASVIEYFNMAKLNFLFCTSTIIEGVNTSAKNVIIYENKKSTNTIDAFDKANIKGRAGRLMEHYVGKLYMFHKKLENVELDIDVPYIDQKEISPEILIHLPDASIKDKNSDEYQMIKNLTEDERELFRNNGLKIEGQKNILKLLFKNFNTFYSTLFWFNYPTYEQLNFLINLCWENLLNKSEKKAPAYTANRLTSMTFNYIQKQGNLKLLIEEEYRYLLNSKNNLAHCPVQLLNKIKNKDDFQIYQLAILNILDATRHWYMYKIPKWLSIMNNLQNYVCNTMGTKPGDYTLMSSLMENSYLPENLSILLEIGIPVSAVNKLKKIYSNNISEDFIISDLRSRVQNNLIDKSIFLEYEIEKIKSEIM